MSEDGLITVTGRVISQIPMEIGGEICTAFFDEDYEGKTCVLTHDEIVAVLPNVQEGLSVGRYAITPDGGYSSVGIFAATEEPITHESFEEWLQS